MNVIKLRIALRLSSCWATGVNLQVQYASDGTVMEHNSVLLGYDAQSDPGKNGLLNHTAVKTSRLAQIWKSYGLPAVTQLPSHQNLYHIYSQKRDKTAWIHPKYITPAKYLTDTSSDWDLGTKSLHRWLSGLKLLNCFNCCFTVHFYKFKAFWPTNALFIKT
jgi:hypothetical protein